MGLCIEISEESISNGEEIKMKKVFTLFAFMLCAGVSYAGGPEVNKSSYTVTAETTKRIAATEKGNMLYAVVVGSATPGSVLTIYDSSGTATNTIATISLHIARDYNFNVLLSSGLTYTTSAAPTNGLTILWR